MKQARYSFRWRWTLSSMAAGLIVTAAYEFGSHHHSWGLLLGGAVVGFSIYIVSEFLSGLLGGHIEKLSPSFRAPARILFGIIAGFIGWVLGFVVTSLILTGRPLFEEALGPGERSLLLIALAITILFGALAHGYEELRRRLTASVEKLKEQEYAEKELEVARSIQSRLLPPPTIEGHGFIINARHLAAHFVAGDFYDVLLQEDGSVGIVIADVSGKGLGASLIMASVKAVLPFVADGAVGETLSKLNARLITQLGPREFVALAYARFHPDTGKLQLANAGMPDPYIISNGIATPISLTGQRLPLGARADVHYDVAEAQLEPGDRFFLLSDGIPEAMRTDGSQLGYDALRETLTGNAPDDRSIDTVIERFRAQVVSIDDDWTAVMLERTATDSPAHRDATIEPARPRR